MGYSISSQDVEVREMGSQRDDECSRQKDDRVHYKTMTWVHAGIGPYSLETRNGKEKCADFSPQVMIAETISLGVLSLPRALSTLGFVPGVLLILMLGLAATYTGYVVYQFKRQHPDMNSFADAGFIAFGKAGRWIGEILQDLLLIFIMSAHVLTFTIMMNTLTEHGLCTIAFGIIGTMISFVASMPRTLKANSYISIFSCISIATATIVAMIGIGVARPGTGTGFAVVPNRLSSFTDGAMSVSNIILAYNGHIAYPTIISEMKEPRDFPKALILLESVTISFYIIVAVVVYYYAGQDVASPALGSASPLISKIAFGIAIPTIIVAGVIPAVVAAKSIYKQVWIKQPHVVSEKSMRARASWYAIIGAVWALAWAIASAIPVFNQLVALMGALLGTWFCLGFCAMMWLWMNWNGSLRKSYGVTWAKISLFTVNVVILAMGLSLCVLGTYASVKAIATNGASQAPFSCANNALRS